MITNNVVDRASMISDDIVALTTLMFVSYLVVLIIALFLCNESYRSKWHRMVERCVEGELDAIGRIGRWFANRYWQIRCWFSKRWWHNRPYYKSTNFGMSWEGKEKDYLQRYAQSK